MTNRRLTRLLLRVLTLVILSLVLALGALVVLENAELRRVWPPTPLRTLSVLAAPVAAIWLTNFTQAVRSFGHRSLVSEVLIASVPTLTYLAITLSLIGSLGEIAGCSWFDPFCEPVPLAPRVQPLVLLPLLAAAAGCLSLLLKRER